MFLIRRPSFVFPSVMLLLIGSSALNSQTISRRPQALIRERVDENKLVTLGGNTRPEANAPNDLGAVSDTLSMDHMMLQLKRSPQQDEALAQLISALHDPKSPSFHQWLNATDFGKNFGPAESDVEAVTGWLESQGFT